MRGYGPPTTNATAWLLTLLLAVVAVGLWFMRAPPGRRLRLGAWLLLGVAVGSGLWATAGERAGNRMLLLCAAVFFSMKLVVTAEARLAGRPMPTVGRYLSFLFLWPGMRPWAFATRDAAARRGAARDVGVGLGCVAAGAGLLAAARAVGPAGSGYVPALLLAVAGLSLVLHFGLFRALAGAWRWRGVGVAVPFDAPWRSTSLAELWSRRWNRVFSEMAQVSIHRPLTPLVGPLPATVAVFLFSGLLHDLAVSVPAGWGYGLPTLYFALQVAALFVEQRLGIGTSRRSNALSRAWALGWFLLPVLLLFHLPFLDACVVPLLE